MVLSLATALLLTLAANPVADVFVDSSFGGCGAGSGTALDPVCSIGAAIGLAVPGDTIRIAPGTYVENLVIGFDLDFVGTAGAFVTIVDGGGGGSVVTVPNTVTVSIDGLTVTNGLGSGVHVMGALTLVNSTITGNHSLPYGCGAGVSCDAGAVALLDRCTIESNVAHGGPGGAAGGGGVCTSGDLVIVDSTIRGNQILDVGTCAVLIGGGGVAARTTGSLLIEDSTISGNSSECDGAGVFSDIPGTVVLRNSTVSGNEASGVAGGIFAVRVQLENVTVTQNRSVIYASGVITSLDGSALNSLIAGNLDLLGAPAADIDGTFSSLGHNLIGYIGNVSGPGFTDGVNGDLVGTMANPIDALLGPLLDHGGLTQTHALAVGSQAIDAGDMLVFEPVDQRGTMRPAGVSSDIGALEFDSSAISFCNGDGGNQAGCTSCPCGNEAPSAMGGTTGGCINSAGTPARLGASGDPSVSLPAMSTLDLRFALSGTPALAFCILSSGAALAPTNAMNPCFGLDSGVQSIVFDGLRCAVNSTRRHGGRAADSGGLVGTTNSPWGGEGGPGVGLAQAFGGFAAGETRYFQSIYRDDPFAVCMRGLNTSQAIEVVFTP